MPVYMYEGTYSREAISALVENPQNRTAAVNAVVEANGGKRRETGRLLDGIWRI